MVRPNGKSSSGLLCRRASARAATSTAGLSRKLPASCRAVVERLGRESGAFVSMIRTDMHLLTKGPAGEGANVRNLNYFDAIFYMGEGPWNIRDQQKADLLSFVHED